MDTAILFEDAVAVLARKRKSVAALTEQVNALRRQWELQHRELLDRLDRAKRDAAVAEGHLRDSIVSYYCETGIKKPHPLLGVRVSEVPIVDAEQLRDWIREHPDHDWLLVTDEKALVK